MDEPAGTSMKILLLDAHPDPASLCAGLARSYLGGATEGGRHEVRFAALRELHFNPVLQHGYRQRTELEADLLGQQESIRWCEHLVVVTPLWWMSTPALLKGYFDRVFLPGFAFKYRDDSPLWDRLLSGRSARVIYTQDSPQWFARFFRGDAFWRALNHGTLGFAGFAPVRRTIFAQIRKSTPATRDRWLAQTRRLGENAR